MEFIDFIEFIEFIGFIGFRVWVWGLGYSLP